MEIHSTFAIDHDHEMRVVCVTNWWLANVPLFIGITADSLIMTIHYCSYSSRFGQPRYGSWIASSQVLERGFTEKIDWMGRSGIVSGMCYLAAWKRRIALVIFTCRVHFYLACSFKFATTWNFFVTFVAGSPEFRNIRPISTKMVEDVFRQLRRAWDPNVCHIDGARLYHCRACQGHVGPISTKMVEDFCRQLRRAWWDPNVCYVHGAQLCYRRACWSAGHVGSGGARRSHHVRQHIWGNCVYE